MTRLLRYTPHITLLEQAPAARQAQAIDQQPATRQEQAQIPDGQTPALEVSGSLRLFGGIRPLLRAIRADCPPGTRTGLAPTALGACLLARRQTGTRHVLRLRSLARLLDALPCAALPTAPDQLERLRELGCHHLGVLRALPRTGLRNRGHAALIALLDQAYGQTTPIHPWLSAAARFFQAHELDYHCRSASAIETACTPLITALCAWLDTRQGATDTLTLDLLHDSRRAGTPPATPVCLRTARPEWIATRFRILLREHLARHPLPAPVVRIVLRCERIQPRAPRTASLLFDDTPSPDREAALLDLLRARLGPHCLHFPDPVAQHIPERTDRWRARDTPMHDHLPQLSLHSRPLWLLPRAVALSAPDHRPLLEGTPLALIAGPERIEGGWWVPGQSPIARDYFIARDARGARYWIYRDHHAAGWFLHGLFG